jgi:hypothetical protein
MTDIQQQWIPWQLFSKIKDTIGTIGTRELKFQLSLQKLQNSACITKLLIAIIGLEL